MQWYTDLWPLVCFTTRSQGFDALEQIKHYIVLKLQNRFQSRTVTRSRGRWSWTTWPNIVFSKFGFNKQKVLAMSLNSKLHSYWSHLNKLNTALYVQFWSNSQLELSFNSNQFKICLFSIYSVKIEMPVQSSLINLKSILK